MKKIAVMLALTLALTACGGGAGDADRYEAAQTAAMAEAGSFSEELEEVDADTAFALYRLAGAGLSREDLKECVGNTAFQFHMKDILEYRTMEYYRRRYVQV